VLGRGPVDKTHDFGEQVHASEVSYVFGTLDRGIFPRCACTRHRRTNFAKTGDPNGDQLPAWPKFDPSSRAYIQFTNVGPISKEGLRRPYCDIFIENVRRLMPRQEK
jgi:para-nitrobenzyl esterase